MKSRRIDLSAYDLVEIIGNYTELKKEGNFYRSVEHSSLVIDQRNNRFYWNSKGIRWGTIIDFFMAFYNVSFESALRIVKGASATRFEPEASEERKEYTKLSWGLAENHHEGLTQGAIEWWLSRGVLRESINKLKLGQCYRKGIAWATIPIPSEDGTYVANYKIRRMSDHPTLPRYMQYTSGLEPVWYAPFGVDAERIVMVAGEIKAIVLGQYGIPVFSSSSGVSTWSDNWKKVIYGKEIVLCFDPKEHGEDRPSSMIRKKISPFAGLVEELPLEYDPDDAIVKYGMSPEAVARHLGVEVNRQ